MSGAAQNVFLCQVVFLDYNKYTCQLYNFFFLARCKIMSNHEINGPGCDSKIWLRFNLKRSFNGNAKQN